MKKILILGASGFIGRHLKEELSKDPELRVYSPSHSELDLYDKEKTKNYMVSQNFDVVFHCAVYRPKKDDNSNTIIENDKKLFDNLAECSEYYGKMIYLGSGAEYDKRYPIVKVVEEEIGKTIPTSDYGLAKYEIGQAIEKSHNIYNFRVFGMFGYGEDWQSTFISNAICKSLYGYPISIRKDVEFTYMWIKDFCKIAQWAIDADFNYHTYNMGTKHTYCLSELAEVICKVAGNPMPVFICEEGMGNEYTASGERLYNEFQQWEETPIEEAISLLYNEYREHKTDISLRKLIYNE